MAFTLITAENGVKYLKSDIISASHGFATRVGGVSTLSHTASLNLAFRRGDEEETVLENLKLFCNAVGTPPESVVSLHQTHSDIIEYVTAENAGEGYFRMTDRQCDGYVTDKKGVTLGVKTADCVPILFCDPEAHIIGAVHAGWRGTVSGIAAKCIRRMCALGASENSICAAIGAAIHFCCYEVGEDFRDSVASAAGSRIASEFIRERDGALHADIVSMNRRFLLEAGLSEKHIDISDMCTCHNPELFFSHRYSHGVRGTMLSVIAL